MQTFAWQGIEFEHPDDWECVRFSKNRKRGECALADPRGKRLSLLWSVVDAKAVDSKRILDEAAAQLRKSDPSGEVVARPWQAPKGRVQWAGIEWRGTDDLTVALAHFPHEGYLLQAQFTTDRRTDLALQRRVLESVRCQSATGVWSWRAFGCDLRLPGKYALQSCEVVPGRATLEFATEGRKRQRVRVERFALPETQLNGRSMKAWYAGTLERPQRVMGSGELQVGPHRGIEVNLKPSRPTPLQLLTMVKRRSRALVWVCEREARLYTLEWDGAVDGAPELGEVVACCGGIARVEPCALQQENSMAASER